MVLGDGGLEEMFRRGWSELIAPDSGPLHGRLVLQPLVATTEALRSSVGSTCARTAKSPARGGPTVRRSKPARSRECKSHTGKAQPAIPTPSHALTVARPAAKR